jgi:FkbM family methyltransferase
VASAIEMTALGEHIGSTARRIGTLGRRLERKVRGAVFSGATRHLRRLQRPPTRVLARYGTAYGGWWIDRELAMRTIAPHSCVVSAGAGEDISFDLEIQRRFHCRVVIVDPTPRAIRHFEGLLAHCDRNVPFAINNSSTAMYDVEDVDVGKLHFVPAALWSRPRTLKLWAPYNPAHVSHSATNLQRTRHFIEVSARTVADILAEYGTDRTPLLKLDIEGAELVVLEQILNSELLPAQIAVEFDFISNPGPGTVRDLQRVTDRLQAKGYELAHFDGSTNCLFVRDR